MTRKPVVTARWNPGTKWWVAHSDDGRGLDAEAQSLDSLAARVIAAASELAPNDSAETDSAIIGETIDLHILVPYSIGKTEE